MGTCCLCHKRGRLISKTLGMCGDCIRNNAKEARPFIEDVHRQGRVTFRLPHKPPKNTPGGRSCRLCANECRISSGKRGFCGIRENKEGKLTGGTPRTGNVSWYHDPLPTNCVASWVCPGGTGAGYPEVAYRNGPEFGYKNLAVFYQACNYDCLFCQNWHYRESVFQAQRVSATRLAAQIDEGTSCICYFGGDPTPQLPHALYASRLARGNAKKRILRICWETNGAMHPRLLHTMGTLSLETGGCIKFDLKAWNEDLHKSLCGVSNKRTLENFCRAAVIAKKRDDPPLIVASTLLVPGYVDEEEVAGIARFIASINTAIPFALLAFHPQFFMADLPATSREHAESCKRAAERQGLERVRIGNMHLLREQSY